MQSHLLTSNYSAKVTTTGALHMFRVLRLWYCFLSPLHDGLFAGKMRVVNLTLSIYSKNHFWDVRPGLL